MAHTSKRIIALSERFYHRLLVVYPATFRRQYGSQMMQVFLDCCRAAYQKRGSWGVLRLWIFVLGDLLINAIAEQLSARIQRLRTRKAIFDTQVWPLPSGRGGNMLHITNGDSVGGTLRQTGLPGDILTWKDILHEGPTPTGLSLEQMTPIRAQFLAANAMGTYEDRLTDFVQRDTTLAQFAAHNEVILWFEHDLYDQLQLIQILDWFSHHKRSKTTVSLICINAFPGIPKFFGLGQLNADQLRSLYETRHRLTTVEFRLGSEAWNAYCSPDPKALEAFLRKDTSALPFLKAALLRHLEQFPALQGGLSRTERQILEVIASGTHKPLAIFRTTQEKEQSPFMGDSSLWLYLSTLSTGPKPFLKRADGGAFAFPATDPTTGHYDTAFIEQELVLTNAGVNALAGQIDWIQTNQGIDRWLGGVHLLGRDAAWRWDRQREVLVQAAGTV